MEPLEHSAIRVYRTLTWNLYSQRRLYGLVIFEIILTIAFFYYSSGLSQEECSGISKTFLSIGKYFYLVMTIYSIMTLSSRLKVVQNSGSFIDVGSTKNKLDNTDFLFLVGWLGLNVGMVIAFIKRNNCSASNGFLWVYFIFLVGLTMIVIMSICCVGWFSFAVVEINKRQQEQNKELDQYNRL